MLLSKRERPPDNIAATSNSPSSISYRRTSIPSISPLLVLSPTSTGSIVTPRRAPLAPLDPQVASSMPLDNQSPTPSSSSSSSYPAYSSSDAGKDADRVLETTRVLIGRPIITRSQEEEPSTNPLSLRKKSIPGHANAARPSPYPLRSAQRRPSNTLPSTDPRRPSLPNALHPPPSPSNIGLSPSPHLAASLTDYSHPAHQYNEDLYSGLSTFTFGAARPLPSPHGSDSSDMISPLTRVSGSGSADRTPRPSVSSASSGRRKSRSHRIHDPDEGDDEYEDEDDAVRSRTRSKMRAIDDGSRRPSLPTNAYLPSVSTESQAHLPSSTTALELSPGGSSASESAYDDSEADQDEGEPAEFDTDVELDLPHGSGAAGGLDAPVSDTASQHTFGAGSFDHYGSDHLHADDRLSILSDDDEVDSISPVIFTRDGDDEAFDDGDRPLPSLPAQAGGKSSLPWEVPSLPMREGVSTLTHDREDSAATVTARRASRSVDDDLTASTMYPDVQPANHAQVRPEFDIQTADPIPTVEEHEFQYGDYNLDYILGRDSVSRRSWSSGAPSYIQTTRRGDSGDPSALGAAWDAALGGSRRPSTATVNSGDDAFTRQVRHWDPDYGTRKGDWTFKKESTDGRGPHRMPLVPSTSTDVSPHTMQPGTQEIWRQAYVGRYKVDRVKMNPDQPAKAPQQRLNIRHIHDPYSKGNTQGGPGSVIHKHSRAVAFSIFRNHSLFSKTHRQYKQPMHTSISILLANKKVQEQYTSTRTTSKLNSHGLLEDVGTMGTTAAYSQSRTMVASMSMSPRSRPSTPHPVDGSQSDGYTSDQRGQSSTRSSSVPMEISGQGSSAPPPVPQKSTPNTHTPTHSSSSMDATETIRVSGESTVASDPSSSTDRASTYTSQSSATHSLSRQSSVEMDDEDSPPRTSHAEAFATVDSSYFERTRPDRRHVEEPSSHGLVGVLRRKLLGSAKSGPKPQSVHPPSLPREGNYTPPWLTMAPRSKQEERERVIQNLNDSFKDVGLLPTARVNKHSGTKSKRPRHPNTTTIFEKVPTDALYMLLPLWPGDTDPTSSEAREDPASYFVPVEERQYLLVYYVPFDDEKSHDKKADSQKKRTRADTRSIATASSTTLNDRIISLRSFKAVARLVSYADLRETGVRVPAFGLSVTGSLTDATQFLPPTSIREQRLDDIVIGVCYNRLGGVEFITEGLQKLGLCMPTETPPKPPSNEMDDEEEEEVVLTPIGRAAVEMAWLGCMAVTSFAST